MSDDKRLAEAVVTIACVQMEPVVGQKERNVRRTVEPIEEAAGAAPAWSCCPSCATRATVFESREEAFALAEEVPKGRPVTAWT